MRWPRFLRRRPAAPKPRTLAELFLDDAKRMVPVDTGSLGASLDDPALLHLDATADTEEPYDGGLTWEQFSASMEAVEGTYRDALRGGRGFQSPPVPEWPPWAREQLDKLDQDDAASGKLEP